MLVNAIEVAQNWHKGQFRKNQKVQLPYHLHPSDVIMCLVHWGVNDEEVLSGAALHDVVEDTPCQLEDLFDFSYKVRLYVEEMTQEEGISKEDYINKFENCSIESFVIKLADRFCNIIDFACEYKYKKYFKSLERFFTLYYTRRWEIVDRFGEKTAKRILFDFEHIQRLLKRWYDFDVELKEELVYET